MVNIMEYKNLMQSLSDFLPREWSFMNLECMESEYELIDVTGTVDIKLGGHLDLGIKRVMRVQNPYLYGQFLLRKAEYELKGDVIVQELFYDTAESKVDSIISNNLDRRSASHIEYWEGITFSPSPMHANRQSSGSNDVNRAMIVAEVLKRSVECSFHLPTGNHDTTISNNGQVHIKYYDDEFYPKYVVYYENTLNADG